MHLVYLTIISMTYVAHAVGDIHSVPNGGLWGEWSLRWSRCNSPARGFRQKIEGNQGSGDDTGLNAIGLLCNNEVVTSEGVKWGQWRDDIYCPDGEYLVAFALKVEENQGSGDDTAANEIRFRCTNGQVIQDPNGTPWGSWGPWSGSCRSGMGFCWIKTKIEHPVHFRDDTAFNDVKFMCCHA